MKVSDLVRLKPEHNDVGWLDVIFVIIEEDKTTGMVTICNGEWKFPMPKRFLELVYE